MNRMEALDEFLRELKAGSTIKVRYYGHYYRIQRELLLVSLRQNSGYTESEIEFNDLLERLAEGFEVVARPAAPAPPQAEVRHVRRVEL